MPYYVVQRDPARFPFGSLTSVQADGFDDGSETGVMRFSKDERTCFEAPADDVLSVTEFEHQLQAEEHMKKLRRWRSGRSTVHVQESGGVAAAPKRRGAAARPHKGGAVPAEGITFKINET